MAHFLATTAFQGRNDSERDLIMTEDQIKHFSKIGHRGLVFFAQILDVLIQRNCLSLASSIAEKVSNRSKGKKRSRSDLQEELYDETVSPQLVANKPKEQEAQIDVELLQSMKIGELKKMATDLHLPSNKKKKKKELVESIIKASLIPSTEVIEFE